MTFSGHTKCPPKALFRGVCTLFKDVKMTPGGLLELIGKCCLCWNNLSSFRNNKNSEVSDCPRLNAPLSCVLVCVFHMLCVVYSLCAHMPWVFLSHVT